MDPLALVNTLLRRNPVGRHHTILELDLDYGVQSAPPDSPMKALRSLNAPSMAALREGLRKAADDEDVLGLIVHVGTCPLTHSQVDELSQALVGFGERRPVWAYAESFGEIEVSLQQSYRLACAAQRIWLQPSGQVGLGGVRASMTVLGGTLRKVGIEPQLGQRHEFKTAAETFAGQAISDANREMTGRLAESIAETSIGWIAERRGIPSDRVREAVEGGALPAEQAKQRGFVDDLGYRDEVYARAREAWGGRAIELQLRYVHRHVKGPSRLELLTQKGRPAVAQVMIRGNIVPGRPQRPGSGQPQATSELVCQELRAAGRDDNVKAVVLRVDSPGGSYIASDTIRREVLQLKATGRPVVASMGDVAASGGYFVSMPATEIVANPTTLTGSIGVLAGKFVLAQLKERIGLVSEDVATSPWATMMSGNAGFTEEQWAALNRWLDTVYADFVGKAAADRGVPFDELEPQARGRVWTGADARERGLVDHLGGMDLAIDRACALAAVRRDDVLVRPVNPLGFLTQFRPAESSESVTMAGQVQQRSDLDTRLAAFGAMIGLEVPGVLALPFRIDLH